MGGALRVGNFCLLCATYPISADRVSILIAERDHIPYFNQNTSLYIMLFQLPVRSGFDVAYFANIVLFLLDRPLAWVFVSHDVILLFYVLNIYAAMFSSKHLPCTYKVVREARENSQRH